MGSFDVETLAQRTVDLMDVRPGHVIWIWASSHSLDLIEALAFRIPERGAFWTVPRLSPHFLPDLDHRQAAGFVIDWAIFHTVRHG